MFDTTNMWHYPIVLRLVVIELVIKIVEQNFVNFVSLRRVRYWIDKIDIRS